jgi:hypothetical protein
MLFTTKSRQMLAKFNCYRIWTMKTLSLILTLKTFPVTYTPNMIPSGGEICKLQQVRIEMSSLQQELNPTLLKG